jgi:transaldolase
MVQFFLDTASIEEIKHWNQYDLVNGVTTNPALLSAEGVDPISRIKEIAEIVDGSISVEVTYKDPEKMIEQAKRLNKISNNLLIKVPASLEGYLLAKELKKLNIKTNVTLIFHPSQAIPFIKLNCEYISLFVGRVEDFGLDNTRIINESRKCIDIMNSETKLLSASIRNPTYLIDAIKSGSDAITVPPSTWKKVYNNPMFLLGENEFLSAWENLPEHLRKIYEKID